MRMKTKQPEQEDIVKQETESNFSKEDTIGYIGANDSGMSDGSPSTKPPSKKQKAQDQEELCACDGCHFRSVSKDEMVHQTKYLHKRPANVEEYEKVWTENLAIVEQ